MRCAITWLLILALSFLPLAACSAQPAPGDVEGAVAQSAEPAPTPDFDDSISGPDAPDPNSAIDPVQVDTTSRLIDQTAPIGPEAGGGSHVEVIGSIDGEIAAVTPRQQVDAVCQVSHLHQALSVAAATTTALAANTYSNGNCGQGATLTATTCGAMANVDGYSAAVGDRLLVKNEGTASHDGVYNVVSLGSVSTKYQLKRTPDFEQGGMFVGAIVYVVNGTANGGRIWANTNTSNPTMGTTSITWAQFSPYAIGTGLALCCGTLKSTVTVPSLPLGVPCGGTGKTSIPAGDIPIGNGSSTVNLLAPGCVNGKVIKVCGGAFVVGCASGGITACNLAATRITYGKSSTALCANDCFVRGACNAVRITSPNTVTALTVTGSSATTASTPFVVNRSCGGNPLLTVSGAASGRSGVSICGAGGGTTIAPTSPCPRSSLTIESKACGTLTLKTATIGCIRLCGNCLELCARRTLSLTACGLTCHCRPVAKVRATSAAQTGDLLEIQQPRCTCIFRFSTVACASIGLNFGAAVACGTVTISPQTTSSTNAGFLVTPKGTGSMTIKAAATGSVGTKLVGNGTGQTGDILDINQNCGGNTLFRFSTSACAHNGLRFCASCGFVTIQAQGTSSNICLLENAKGNGSVIVRGHCCAVSLNVCASSSSNTADILDLKQNTTKLFKFGSVASARNGLTFGATAACNSPTITAQGCATNLSIIETAKGTGSIIQKAAASGSIGTKIVGNGSGQTGDLLDILQYCGGNTLFKYSTVSSARNGLTFGATASCNAVTITAQGCATNLSVLETAKGTGSIIQKAAATGSVGTKLIGNGTGQTGDIADILQSCGGKTLFKFGTVACARNGLTFGATASCNAVTVTAQGCATNLGVKLASKGAAGVTICGGFITKGRLVSCANATLAKCDMLVVMKTGGTARTQTTVNKACAVLYQTWESIKLCSCALGTITPTAGTCVTLIGTTTAISTQGKRIVYRVVSTCCGGKAIIDVSELLHPARKRPGGVRLSCGKHVDRLYPQRSICCFRGRARFAQPSADIVLQPIPDHAIITGAGTDSVEIVLTKTTACAKDGMQFCKPRRPKKPGPPLRVYQIDGGNRIYKFDTIRRKEGARAPCRSAAHGR